MQDIIDKFSVPHWKTIWTIGIVFLVMLILIILVGIAVRRADPRKKPSRTVEFTCYFCGGMKNLIEQNMGKRFLWFGPYIVFLMTFFLTSVTIGILGFPVVMTNISVPLTLALVMFAFNWALSIRDNKHKHFTKFLNPLNVAGEVAPVISMSFRLFGNMVAGGIILTLVDYALGNLWTSMVPSLSQSNILGGLVTAPMRLYFDVFSGLVQAYIFTLLTVIYIGLVVKSDDQIEAEKTIKAEKVKNKSIKQTTPKAA